MILPIKPSTLTCLTKGEGQNKRVEGVRISKNSLISVMNEKIDMNVDAQS